MTKKSNSWHTIWVLGLLILLSSTPARATAALSSDELLAAIEADCEAKLGVDVSLSLREPLPALRETNGEPEISLRYSPRPGQWLPTALVLSTGGRQCACIPLYRYVDFSLPVLIVPNGISARSIVGADALSVETLRLRAGREVLCTSDLAIGNECRMALKPGDQLLFSALRAAYDLRRGQTLTLVLRVPGMEVQASATALGDAYVGQRVTVRRDDDRKQFSGLLEAGPRVVVE